MERNLKIIATVVLLSAVSLTPGITIMLYSQTYVVVGFGAIDWWWDSHFSSTEEAIIMVNSTHPQASLIIHGGQLHISSFNITGGNVIILVGCETNSTIARYDSVTGELAVYLVYPTEDPTNFFAQDYNVTIILEEDDSLVTFEYYFFSAQHADGSVTYIRQGYDEIHTLGSNLLLGGLIIAGVIISFGLFLYLMYQRQPDKT